MKSIGYATDQCRNFKIILENVREKRQKTSDVVDLFEETMNGMKDFVKKNIGEFSFRCLQCGTVVQTNGLPHFAIMTETDDRKNKIYHIYSPELAYLVREKIIPLHLMAFILRTSPEGIVYTAKEREEDIKSFLDKTSLEEEEKKLKEIRNVFEK